ncbi:hypothetical protein FQN57_006991 [Myotisia sp. PD_48]|nr:hypothetical protein FQN57_006991 [Myotisia sp. PD_48]
MTTSSSKFSSVVVDVMKKLYPEELADKSFDNTGLLLDAPARSDKKQKNSVLLTIDLTKAVADEAIRRGDSIIIAYHPIIFRGLKSLTLANSQQSTLLRLAQEGISVYSPHTAVDAIPGGMADWLCDRAVGPQHRMFDVNCEHITIHPNPSPPPGFEGAGMGRLVKFPRPVALAPLLRQILDGIFPNKSSDHGASVAIPQGKDINSIEVSSLATCPGSGSSVLMKNGLPVADVLLTGEMSHHDALAAIEAGSVVVSLFHSNAERGYLRDVMLEKLMAGLRKAWGEALDVEHNHDTNFRMAKELFEGGVPNVDVSEQDKDPYNIIMYPATGGSTSRP